MSEYDVLELFDINFHRNTNAKLTKILSTIWRLAETNGYQVIGSVPNILILRTWIWTFNYKRKYH